MKTKKFDHKGKCYFVTVNAIGEVTKVTRHVTVANAMQPYSVYRRVSTDKFYEVRDAFSHYALVEPMEPAKSLKVAT